MSKNAMLKESVRNFALGFLLLALSMPGAAYAVDAATLCIGCSSDSDFRSAAVAEVGWVHGEHDVLVVDPVTGDGRTVFVMYTPPGYEPLGFSRSVKQRVQPGNLVVLGKRASVWTPQSSAFAAELLGAGVVAHVSPLTSGQQAQVNAVVELTRRDLVVVLDSHSSYYGSFAGRNAEATQLQLYSALTQHNPAWAGTSVRSALIKLLVPRLASYFGVDMPRVCAIFNNGDSACFEIKFNVPSVDGYVEGTAKDSSGDPIGHGGGDGGVQVIPDLPRIFFGPRGGSGSSGEVWLVCTKVGGVIQYCYIEEV